MNASYLFLLRLIQINGGNDRLQLYEIISPRSNYNYLRNFRLIENVINYLIPRVFTLKCNFYNVVSPDGTSSTSNIVFFLNSSRKFATLSKIIKDKTYCHIERDTHLKRSHIARHRIEIWWYLRRYLEKIGKNHWIGKSYCSCSEKKRLSIKLNAKCYCKIYIAKW